MLRDTIEVALKFVKDLDAEDVFEARRMNDV